MGKGLFSPLGYLASPVESQQNPSKQEQPKSSANSVTSAWLPSWDWGEAWYLTGEVCWSPSGAAPLHLGAQRLKWVPSGLGLGPSLWASFLDGGEVGNRE